MSGSRRLRINPQVARDGFCLARGLLDSKSIAKLIALVEASANGEERRGGVRNLLDLPGFRALAASQLALDVVLPILGEGTFAVRGILFDKTEDANWKVPWHQDVTIAVTERIDVEGYGPWSLKAGVLHVQPPAAVLEQMVSLRIHLDDCPAENGALRVLPGTHREGKLSQRGVDALASEISPVTCEAAAGDALLMRPLLLHASSSSSVPRHRRIIHFDYANVELAAGLEWRERYASHVSESRHGAPEHSPSGQVLR